MSKKLSVRSLSDSSLAELANLLVSTISYVQYAPDVNLDINIVMVELNEYLTQAGATSNIYQDLLRVILSSDYLEANMRFTCLQMLLNCGVHFLVTEVFPPSYYEKILQVIAAQGAALRVLNLKGIWVKEEHMHYMYEIVRRCKQLIKLYVPYIANDQLLEEIATNCNRLQILDISGETDITEIGIDFLAKGNCAQSLTIVDVGMPELMSLLEKPIGRSLRHLTMIKGSGNLELGKLARVCPILIDLDCYVIESLSYAQPQARFQQLEGLEILSCEMMSSSLKAFLCSVTDLKRLAVDSVDFTDEDIVSMFVQHDFKVLEDIWFTIAPELTVQAVELLMESCPELQSVGQLTGWSLSPDDLALIRGLLKSGNSSLVLTSNGLLA
ncbi:uncharacterized protein LOC111599380 isoform X3 [Drosophila hydei]|uniref:Uncharacterized protein LOC111599380 isoform X3 n=1 Tax=Drosophila hydei TaxID=7224 RepID=A0A6J1LWB6_DROHY|nr:uncharacterized protein LOC111599380 isoform X3 [Drosophila hydei]